MCVDLARCLDTLEQDLVILLRTTTTCIHIRPVARLLKGGRGMEGGIFFD